MDLSLHARVLRRYWYLVAGGFALGLFLAILTVARPTLDGGVPAFRYRHQEAWQSRATLLLTRTGFPEGRVAGTTDFGRLAYFAGIYANLATSDAVTARLRKSGPIDGGVSAGAVLSANQQPTPFLAIAGTASTPAKATALTERATSAFTGYVAASQKKAGIAPNDRILVKVVDAIKAPTLVTPRKKTLPIVVFLAVMSAAIALVYILDGARRRRETLQPVEIVKDDVPQAEAAEEAVSSRRWA